MAAPTMPIHEIPGIVIDGDTSVPNALAPIATAVPAFIGYTPRADYHGVSYTGKPVRISSFEDFRAYFMLPDPPPPADPARQYRPQYYLIPQASEPGAGAYLDIDGTHYAVLPDPGTIYYLYNSVRAFYLNGGTDAWIVSVGGYGPPHGKPLDTPGAPPVNPNVRLDELSNGLASLKGEPEPTIYLCPEATLLSPGDNATLMREMLLQAQMLGTAMCLFDVVKGDQPDPILFVNDIETFRSAVGNQALDRGVCYYPFIGTNIVADDELDFTNLFGGDAAQLARLVSPPANLNPAASAVLATIMSPPSDSRPSDRQLQQNLLAASPTYGWIMQLVRNVAGMLPPSGAMAGIYAVIDSVQGVWVAPANVGIAGATSLPIELTDEQQAGLNVDAVTGKSVNAIRLLNGRGIVVWGARTLDGNSQDWRYVQVRRTAIYIEQSIKQAMGMYVFAPNNANTWQAVESRIDTFLTGLWQRGGLQGATPAEAFAVTVGLGTTMTADDILNGIMRVSTKVALVHPAEFIVITLEQKIEAAGG